MKHILSICSQNNFFEVYDLLNPLYSIILTVVTIYFKNRNLFPFRFNDPKYDLSVWFQLQFKRKLYSLQRECLKKPWWTYNLIISRKKGIKKYSHQQDPLKLTTKRLCKRGRSKMHEWKEWRHGDYNGDLFNDPQRPYILWEFLSVPSLLTWF